MRSVILPYNMGSEGAAALALGMRALRIKREGSRYKHRPDNVIINWGCPERPVHIPEDALVLNRFEAVALASNKLKSFKVFSDSGVSAPYSTESRDTALELCHQGRTLVARTILNGHGGKGIVLIDSPEKFVVAPLYTVYIPKKSEYRVHVIGGRVVDVTRKVLREDHPNKEAVNWKIRNHDNGFIFTRLNKNFLDKGGNPRPEIECCPSQVKREAIRATQALGLDFGAVDVIYNQKNEAAYVLEVNTAPGISETATNIYVEDLRYLAETLPVRVEREKMFEKLMPKKQRPIKVPQGWQNPFDIIVDEDAERNAEGEFDDDDDN
jgi:hypothetical protein